MKSTKYLFYAIIGTALMFVGCDKSTDPITDSSILFEDAAESIAGAVGDESGGVTESFADVMIVGGSGTLGTTTSVMDGADLVTSDLPVYDPITGWWSVSISRSYDRILAQRSITRQYEFQFQRAGNFQQYFVVNGDTATSMKFKIVSGTGYFNTARVTHRLTHLSGAWTSSDLNKDTVTITLDSTYVRSSEDSIKTRSMLRTHSNTLKITSVNIKAPRYRPLLSSSWRNNFAQAISGTISGNYSASISFLRGDAYTERSIDRYFTIDIGSGEGRLSINGGGRFTIGLQNGQRK